MDAIETLKPGVFSDYLKKTENTICGRNPILLMLQVDFIHFLRILYLGSRDVPHDEQPYARVPLPKILPVEQVSVAS